MRQTRQNRPTVSELRYAVPNPNGLQKRKREQAIVAMLSCPTLREAAEQAGIGDRTLDRWRSQPEFQQQYREAQSLMLDAAVNVLRQAGMKFAQTLVEVVDDHGVPAVVRLAAAARGLEILMKVQGYTDLERQLTELEAVVERMEMEGR